MEQVKEGKFSFKVLFRGLLVNDKVEYIQDTYKESEYIRVLGKAAENEETIKDKEKTHARTIGIKEVSIDSEIAKEIADEKRHKKEQEKSIDVQAQRDN